MPNGSGNTPLHWARKQGQVEAVKALLRLFQELKLSAETDRVVYSQLASHPRGQRMLGNCSSYNRKDPYALVAEVHASAGEALKI